MEKRAAGNIEFDASKRSKIDGIELSLQLSSNGSIEDVKLVIEGCLGADSTFLKAALEAVEKGGIKGSDLLSFSDIDFKQKLGLTAFGPRRKLSIVVSAAKEIAVSIDISETASESVQPSTECSTNIDESNSASSSSSSTRSSNSSFSPSSNLSPSSSSSSSSGSNSYSSINFGSSSSSSSSSNSHFSINSGSSSSSSSSSNSLSAGISASAGSGGGSGGGGGGLPLAAHSGGKTASDEAVEDQLNSEASCTGICMWVTTRLHKLLTSTPHWASSTQMRQERLAELAKLTQQTALPSCSVVVVGNTGAGKSTLLNAMLEEVEVLPTNGMRACTACLIELRHGPPDQRARYRGLVTFMSREEWHRELDSHLELLVQQDGRAILGEPEPDAHNYTAWCTVFAVYGEAFAKSREAVTSAEGAKVYRNLMADDLKRKLRNTHAVTASLGRVEEVQADEPRKFRRLLERYMDSKADVTGCSFWPIVKMVTAYGREWRVLRTGAVLVDAPGVNDSDGARDKVVRAHIKEADSVWIVSNITRATNDRTAKNMLSENFRRQLLMDGQFGSLVFVATQSDAFQRSELCRNLGLPPHTPALEAAQARNAFTKQRVQDDFYAGLIEMAVQAGEEYPDRASLEKRFQLPVLTVSSMDYQKLAGVRDVELDGPPAVWGNDRNDRVIDLDGGGGGDSEQELRQRRTALEGTEVPRLRHLLLDMTLRARATNARRHVERLVAFGAGLETLLQPPSQEGQQHARRVAVQAAFEVSVASAPSELAGLVSELDSALAAAFDSSVAPQLGAGAGEAAKEAHGTAVGWGRGQREGGMHWATYKATVRRGGEFRLSMNEQLTAPVFRAVSVQWEKAFVSTLTAELGKLSTRYQAATGLIHDRVQQALVGAGVEEELAKGLRDAASSGVQTKLGAVVDGVKTKMQAQQRDLSRGVTPLVKEQMQPGYSAGMAEAGTGSHRRRCAVIEGHVSNVARPMFTSAVTPAIKALSGLRGEVAAQLRTVLVDRAVAELRTNYGVAWEDASKTTVAARAAIREGVHVAVCEARQALVKLLEAQGAERPVFEVVAAGGEDDDEVLVVADQKKQAAETVDLSDNGVGADAASSTASAPGPPSALAKALTEAVRVKAEKF